MAISVTQKENRQVDDLSFVCVYSVWSVMNAIPV